MSIIRGLLFTYDIENTDDLKKRKAHSVKRRKQRKITY
ncbi:hypothetical protein C4J93_3097 [Pseudomonas sp. R2-37-08W]|nr:hypothetical protein C4J93_3097 [Pseudomonas sp. R2-37-08W]AZF32588.1 hypothetical protein C4J89_3115 [Pseudomonas sp. R4-35-07]